jgi:hypothetical protein
MSAAWRKYSVGILAGGYLLGLIVLPGAFWHHSFCAYGSGGDRVNCALYSTIFWPLALPLHLAVSGSIKAFKLWSPAA